MQTEAGLHINSGKTCSVESQQEIQLNCFTPGALKLPGERGVYIRQTVQGWSSEVLMTEWNRSSAVPIPVSRERITYFLIQYFLFYL